VWCTSIELILAHLPQLEHFLPLTGEIYGAGRELAAAQMEFPDQPWPYSLLKIEVNWIENISN
jgi:hypothetical protein